MPSIPAIVAGWSLLAGATGGVPATIGSGLILPMDDDGWRVPVDEAKFAVD